ncbi:hypothetical protein HPB49_018104 [Dermacentor silvarum]|uniref:Uncharacterized protein n=1 Tax=Dermacentor silvarum TaxID=543639 RepID=A0ACB8CSB6_DERSI|nr:hypothetical protein HPB49_018104 [Dermacentor silvarum]
MSAGTPADKTQPPPSRAAGSKGKALTNWKPSPFSRPGPDDFLVVLKPREHVPLHQAFSENRYGAAFTAYLGPEVARGLCPKVGHRDLWPTENNDSTCERRL